MQRTVPGVTSLAAATDVTPGTAADRKRYV